MNQKKDLEEKKLLGSGGYACVKEYPGSPAISYENPNEEVGGDVILTEKGEYRCRTCNNIIALYRKFNK
jgi:hypothetical protein